MPKSVSFDRKEVLEKVTKLFWKKGFHATSMQDLVDATGLNRSSLYNSFGDKHQLFETALSHYESWQSQTLLNSMEQGISPLESVRLFFLTIVNNIKNDQDHKGCLISNCTTELANSDQKVQQLLINNKEAMVTIFERKVIAAQETGQIDSASDSHLLALYLYSNLQGLHVTALLMNDQSELDALVEKVLQGL